MISRKEAAAIATGYGDESLSVACLGSHSALDISSGAKAEGFKSIVVCERGREETYAKYFKSGGGRGCVDEIILLDSFRDVLKPAITKRLRDERAIFVPHRSFEVYVGYDGIENGFRVPIFGSRQLLRAEERTAKPNQYDLLAAAKIRTPKRFARPEDVDRLAIVKAPEAKRGYERAFFTVSSPEEFRRKAAEMVGKGVATEEGIRGAVIEEYVLGAHYNFNFFYSPMRGELELLGTDTRRQTNLDGILRLPAPEQAEILSHARVKQIEVGHIACTLRESLLEKVFGIGEAFVKASKKLYPPGIIGPFALQGAIVPEEGGEEPVVFDVSLRVPGSPGTRFTPYTEYLFGEPVSVGRRIAMELSSASAERKLGDVVT
ncbi:MAG: formate--phosphoribosylaminoimidazolecarboxamide ligase family protein [Candidatus ainarchaeum sp.]|nr:formate--phosphoribosylaminoimidazolecarboxamide ligase family protein [Candidatus ainarchaeum sp.]